jgi:DNA (cytosine-5)-methyltransferase 1
MPIASTGYTTWDQQLTPKLTCAEYFAGIGLVRLGLEQAGWHVVFANDWAADKQAMYAARFTDSAAHYRLQNIFDLNPIEIPTTLLATASFPCIDLSLAGNLQGIEGKHSSAFWGFIRILQQQSRRPPVVLLENVTGWLTSNQGQDFRQTIAALNQLGYACDVYAIDAAYFVPQSRPRIFVVGMQTASPNSHPKNFHRRDVSLTSTALKRAIAQHSDLCWNFLDLPPLPSKTDISLANIVENLPEPDQRWWSEAEVDRHLRMMSPINLSYLEALRHLPTNSYRTMYRRVRQNQQRAELRKDDIAGCLRTAKGGSSRQMLIRAGNGLVRMRVMTPREYARLQGVPDCYPIPTNVNQALTGFGDAVCVPVISWIAHNILNPLVHPILSSLVADPRRSSVTGVRVDAQLHTQSTCGSAVWY